MINPEPHLKGLDCIETHAYFKDNSNICNISFYLFSHTKLTHVGFCFNKTESNIFQLHKIYIDNKQKVHP